MKTIPKKLVIRLEYIKNDTYESYVGWVSNNKDYAGIVSESTTIDDVLKELAISVQCKIEYDTGKKLELVDNFKETLVVINKYIEVEGNLNGTSPFEVIITK